MIKKKNWCNVDLGNPGNPSQGEVMAVMLQVRPCPSFGKAVWILPRVIEAL